MTIFHQYGKDIQWKITNNTIQWRNSTSVVIPCIEKYKSYNINDYIPPLR